MRKVSVLIGICMLVALALTLNETASRPAATVVIRVFMGTSPLDTKKQFRSSPTGSDYFPDDLFRKCPAKRLSILPQEWRLQRMNAPKSSAPCGGCDELVRRVATIGESKNISLT